MLKSRVVPLSLVLAAGVLAPAAPAAADGISVGTGGSCSKKAGFQFTVTVTNHGPLHWRFKVDSNRARQKWRVRVVDNGHVAFQGTRRTKGKRGVLVVRRKSANRSGTDQVTARAWQIRKGKKVQVCSGQVLVGA